MSLEQFASIVVVDTRSGGVQTLEVGGTPHGLAVAGDTLYVTDRSVDAIRRFTIGSWAEQPPIAAGAMPHIVASRSDGSLAVVNAADDTLTLGNRAVHVSHVPESIAVAVDGRVATAGSVGGMVHVFDRLGAAVEEHEVGGRPVRLLYAPSGRVLAVALSAWLAPQWLATYSIAAILLNLAALAARAASLARNARLRPKSSLQSAIGVKSGRIRQMAMGFTAGSFNTREFFHGASPQKLLAVKWVFLLLVFVLPVLLVAAGALFRSTALMVLAFPVQYAGLLAERWYFFAQANHPQNIYYQAIS